MRIIRDGTGEVVFHCKYCGCRVGYSCDEVKDMATKQGDAVIVCPKCGLLLKVIPSMDCKGE